MKGLQGLSSQGLWLGRHPRLLLAAGRRPALRIITALTHQSEIGSRAMSYITNKDGSLTYQFAKSERPTLPPADGPLTATGTDAYLVSKIAHPGYAADPVIARAQKRADEAGLPDIQVTLMQGQFLAVLARSLRAERILEIGTLAGISTIFLARTLPPHGQIDTLEFSPKHAKIAQENFLDADLYPFPKVHIGAAMETLTDPAGPFAHPPGTEEGLKESERGYDLIFIDADKDNILGYWLQAFRLVRKGGVIIVDNAVRGGRISLEVNDEPDIDVKGLRQIYDWVEADQGQTVIMSCLQTVGAKVWDGFAMATKL